MPPLPGRLPRLPTPMQTEVLSTSPGLHLSELFYLSVSCYIVTYLSFLPGKHMSELLEGWARSHGRCSGIATV